ncbi:MAG TPA: hypothetical protein PKD86_02515 [Gemmatales bacterium]|nr:hypothetical protein [Gemmatales bacterium]HMP58204.1 hypothetical protein [Gemmatales bacterium]
MPIKFRCGACDQLLGIARRKAGAVVDCPTCGAKTVVPRPREGASPAVPPPKGPALSLLERVDVDKLLAVPKEGRLVDSKNKGAKARKSKPAPARSQPKGDPAEMRALKVSAPEPDAEPATDGLALEDGEFADLPMPLAESEVQPLQVFGFPVVPFTLAAIAVLLVIGGAFAAGWWLANR